jgi:hypothetical protein
MVSTCGPYDLDGSATKTKEVGEEVETVDILKKSENLNQAWVLVDEKPDDQKHSTKMTATQESSKKWKWWPCYKLPGT